MLSKKFKINSATFTIFLSLLWNNAVADSFIDAGLAPDSILTIPNAVSNNGTVAGYYTTSGSGSIAFKYANGTYSDLDSATSYAYDITPDGSTIVGMGSNSHATIFNADGTKTDLGVLSSGTLSMALGVSNDASVVVGYSRIPGGIHAFEYQSGIMTDLGTLGGTNSAANDVSGNGLVIIGNSNYDGTSNYHAFKYENNLMTDLGTLGGTQSYSYRVSQDGSVIVGSSEFDGTSNVHAFKYESGIMTDLGTLGGTNSNSTSVSDNGEVIVGNSQITGSTTYHAFKYTNSTMTDLGTLGGTTSYVKGISQDGRIITGFSSTAGDVAIHMFTILDSGNLVDVNNTYAALSKNARQLNSVLNFNSALLSGTLEQDAKIFGKHGISVSVGGRYFGVKSDNNKNNASQAGGTLKVAYQFNKNFHAGVFLDQSVSTLLPNNFKSQNQLPFIGIFATLKEKTDGSGAQLRLAAAYNSADLNISRQVLSHTEAGMGKAGLISKAALAELGYGLKLSQNFMVQPYAAIRISEITRSSYSETSGADFPIAFKSASKKATTAIIGARLNMFLTHALQTRVGGGLEHDLSNSINGYAGNIYVLGDFNLSPAKMQKNRGFANIGISYNLAKLRTIGLDLYYSKQQLNSANSLGAYLQYNMGF